MDKLHRDPEFDAIVIGSGPGGATVARELSKRKKKVLILERGGSAPLKEGLRSMASIMHSVPVGRNLRTASAFTTGGTTALYFGAVCWPPLDTFRALGIDISGELDEARRELPIQDLPDEMMGAQTLRLRQSAGELGYIWGKNPMFLDLAKCAAGYSYEAKWNAREYVQQAVDGGAALITRARARKVIAEGNQAVGVEYTCERGPDRSQVQRAYASRIILAAGAAASPVILRDSGVKNVANHGFRCYPGFALFGIVPGMKGGNTFPACMGINPIDGIALGDANFSPRLFRMTMLFLRRFGRVFRHSTSIGVAVMLKDSLGGSLCDDGHYDKELTAADLRKLDTGGTMAQQILEHAGARSIFRTAPNAAHIGGAINIGEHLDASLETELRNLHVCDGSVTPDDVWSPALTLICLGKYLAGRLSQSL